MSNTTNFGWTKPTVGGDNGNWGSELNATIDAIDAALHNVNTTASNALPSGGGGVTGNTDLNVISLSRGDLGSISGTNVLNLSSHQMYTATIAGATTFTLSNANAGVVVTGFALRLTNAGGAAISWPPACKWPGGSPPAFTAGGVDVIVGVSFDGGFSFDMALAIKDAR